MGPNTHIPVKGETEKDAMTLVTLGTLGLVNGSFSLNERRNALCL